jgi:hypothetical protein
MASSGGAGITRSGDLFLHGPVLLAISLTAAKLGQPDSLQLRLR